MKVTVAALIEASEKNGFPWSTADQNQSVYLGPTHSILSCVVGQGVFNLGGSRFPYFDDADPEDEAVHTKFREVYSYNDITATSYEDAVVYMKEHLAPYTSREVEIG